ncbi:type VII secretion integral membrane protein EccD [Prauserella muralis]|uniref:Type VII secretion integral membrane protein EccD n=1 Tax=Prauserella muralis TaxID=588067 RepID=A0A2V4AR17_9PSEU|nr:type VII secretion integral membrane protein EccD [Prauserella muralis]PXY22829.1 type VII secretion integral membrane protein EccD [Prauserella muralis]TWE28581.1 type VII secretion integral membrane protein EccD [Prauserella muralis]
MTTTLVRVTIDAPARRLDLALPERSTVAELLPGLLRRAGENLPDDGVTDGGWLLRRADGTALELGTTLAACGLRDGEVLHLVPRRLHWPELEYDDLADTIAQGSGRTGRLWGPAHTRAAGLAAGGFATLLALLAIVRAGPPWATAAWVALGTGLLLLLAGTVLARALGDAGAGAVVAAQALPFSFAGGALLLGAGPQQAGFGAPHLLAGCSALLIASVLGYVGVVDRAELFLAGSTAGGVGALGAWLATLDALDGVDGAAVAATVVLLFSPLLGPLSIRLGRVPMPVLPRTTADLVRDDPQPPRRAVYAAVLRADQLLTGMIAGSATVAVVCLLVVARESSTSVIVLLSVLSAGFCLRARLYPALRHRAPLLFTGVFCAGALAAGPGMSAAGTLLAVTAPALLLAGGLAVAAGLRHSGSAPSPFLGRYAELLEVAIVLACVPVLCAVLGLYGIMRGLGG